MERSSSEQAALARMQRKHQFEENSCLW